MTDTDPTPAEPYLPADPSFDPLNPDWLPNAERLGVLRETLTEILRVSDAMGGEWWAGDSAQVHQKSMQLTIRWDRQFADILGDGPKLIDLFVQAPAKWSQSLRRAIALAEQAHRRDRQLLGLIHDVRSLRNSYVDNEGAKAALDTVLARLNEWAEGA